MPSDKILWWMISIILIATTIIDIYTGSSGPIKYLVEANPIYLLTKNFFVLTFLTIFFSIFFIYKLKTAMSFQTIFIFSLAAIFLSYGHLVGTYHNLISNASFNENYKYYYNIEEAPPELQPSLIGQNEQTIRQFQEDNKFHLSTSQLFLFYSKSIGSFILFPMVISIFAFYITMIFYKSRQPEREKIIEQIHKLSEKLVKK